jgi:hypothetical protein
MLIKTPSGYEVTLKDSLNYGQSLELQKILFKGMKVETGKGAELNFENMLDYTAKAFPFLVVSIVKDGKAVEGDLYQEVMSWPVEDGRAVDEAIGKITQPTDAKKK